MQALPNIHDVTVTYKSGTKLCDNQEATVTFLSSTPTGDVPSIRIHSAVVAADKTPATVSVEGRPYVQMHG